MILSIANLITTAFLFYYLATFLRRDIDELKKDRVNDKNSRFKPNNLFSFESVFKVVVCGLVFAFTEPFLSLIFKQQWDSVQILTLAGIIGKYTCVGFLVVVWGYNVMDMFRPSEGTDV